MRGLVRSALLRRWMRVMGLVGLVVKGKRRRCWWHRVDREDIRLLVIGG